MPKKVLACETREAGVELVLSDDRGGTFLLAVTLAAQNVVRINVARDRIAGPEFDLVNRGGRGGQVR